MPPSLCSGFCNKFGWKSTIARRYGFTVMKFCTKLYFLLFLAGYFVLVFHSDSMAMEIVCREDGSCQLKIPNSEIILIWEHSCMKHLEKREWARARQVKQVIDYQMANKKWLATSPTDLTFTQQKLEEAQKAKANVGDAWSCDPPEAKLKLNLLQIGKDPQMGSPVTTGFISSAIDVIDIHAVAQVLSDCESPRLKWSVSIPKYSTNESFAEQNAINYHQMIPQALSGDRGNDLKVEIKVELFCKNVLADTLEYVVGQDEKDQLRQEYIDMKKQTVPGRENLTDSCQSVHFNSNAFNSSRKSSGGKYPFILCRILDRLEIVRNRAGTTVMVINSGFRNPYKNGQINGSGRESMHIYGLAADIALDDFNGDKVTDKEDWDLMAEVAKSEGACIEPKNKAPTWIHMDWRGDCPPNW